MLWPRAIGLDSCFLGLTFLKEVAMAECIIDPFCGVGTLGMGHGALGYMMKLTVTLFVYAPSHNNITMLH